MTSLKNRPATHDQLAISCITAGTKLYRISKASYSSHMHYGKTGDNRYDDSSGTYGVCYLADTLETAVAETLGHGVTTRPDDRYISSAALGKRVLVEFTLKEDIHLAKFFGNGLPRLSLDNNINTTIDRNMTKGWSNWAFHHPSDLNGIHYQSRHLSDQLCVALFDRNAPAVDEKNLGTLDNIDAVLEALFEQGWAIT